MTLENGLAAPNQVLKTVHRSLFPSPSPSGEALFPSMFLVFKKEHIIDTLDSPQKTVRVFVSVFALLILVFLSVLHWAVTIVSRLPMSTDYAHGRKNLPIRFRKTKNKAFMNLAVAVVSLSALFPFFHLEGDFCTTRLLKCFPVFPDGCIFSCMEFFSLLFMHLGQCTGINLSQLGRYHCWDSNARHTRQCASCIHLDLWRVYSLPSINVNSREWIKVNIYRGVNS